MMAQQFGTTPTRVIGEATSVLEHTGDEQMVRIICSSDDGTSRVELSCSKGAIISRSEFFRAALTSEFRESSCNCVEKLDWLETPTKYLIRLLQLKGGARAEGVVVPSQHLLTLLRYSDEIMYLPLSAGLLEAIPTYLQHEMEETGSLNTVRETLDLCDEVQMVAQLVEQQEVIEQFQNALQVWAESTDHPQDSVGLPLVNTIFTTGLPPKFTRVKGAALLKTGEAAALFFKSNSLPRQSSKQVVVKILSHHHLFTNHTDSNAILNLKRKLTMLRNNLLCQTNGMDGVEEKCRFLMRARDHVLLGTPHPFLKSCVMQMFDELITMSHEERPGCFSKTCFSFHGPGLAPVECLLHELNKEAGVLAKKRHLAFSVRVGLDTFSTKCELYTLLREKGFASSASRKRGSVGFFIGGSGHSVTVYGTTNLVSVTDDLKKARSCPRYEYSMSVDNCLTVSVENCLTDATESDDLNVSNTISGHTVNVADTITIIRNALKDCISPACVDEIMPCSLRIEGMTPSVLMVFFQVQEENDDLIFNPKDGKCYFVVTSPRRMIEILEVLCTRLENPNALVIERLPRCQPLLNITTYPPRVRVQVDDESFDCSERVQDYDDESFHRFDCSDY